MKSLDESLREWKEEYILATRPIVICAVAISAGVSVLSITYCAYGEYNLFFRADFRPLALSLLLLGSSVFLLDFMIGLPLFVAHYFSQPRDEKKHSVWRETTSLLALLFYSFNRLNFVRTGWMWVLAIIAWLAVIAPVEDIPRLFPDTVLWAGVLGWLLPLGAGLIAASFKGFPWPSIILFVFWVVPCSVLPFLGGPSLADSLQQEYAIWRADMDVFASGDHLSRFARVFHYYTPNSWDSLVVSYSCLVIIAITYIVAVFAMRRRVMSARHVAYKPV